MWGWVLHSQLARRLKPPSPPLLRRRSPRRSPAAAPAPAVPNPKPALQKPLDLRIGDVRKYMMPNEFREALGAPDADKNTIVVEGDSASCCR